MAYIPGETIRIGHLEVDSPWGNAGGVVKNFPELEHMLNTGTGWVEAGTFTLEKRLGNSENGTRCVYVHIPETGETYNSIGMENIGMDALVPEIPKMNKEAHKAGKPLIFNVAPVSNDPVPETIELVSRCYEAGADAVLLNAGCPNVVTEDGGRHEILSRNPETFHKVLAALQPIVAKYQRIFVRVSPQETYAQAQSITQAIDSAGTVSAVFTPNTWPGEKPPDDQPQLEVPGARGGKSGPATAPDAREQMAWFAMSNGNFDIVSSGGIVDGKELDIRLSHPSGRVKAGAGTTFFWEAKEDWGYAVDRLLWKLLNR